MIYLNYAATTPISKDNLNTYYEVSNKYYSLPSMNKYSNMLEARAKEVVLECFSTKNHSVKFTTSGTYANMYAILGYVNKFESKKHFITSMYEHDSMLDLFKLLEKQGHEVSYVKPNDDGIITFDLISKHIRSNTVLVSIMHMNNELGIVNDICNIMTNIKKVDSTICTVSDMCQSIFKTDVDLNSIDIITYTSHKIYGVKNLGVILYNSNINLQYDINNHTVDLAAAITTAKASKYMNDNKNVFNDKIKELNTYVKQKIDKNDNLLLNVNSDSNIFSIYVKGDMLSESIVNHMYNNDIEISTKSACSTNDKTVSNSLKSLNLDSDRLKKTIRLSISHLTTKDELDKFFELLT